jgi:hypothetical protein
MGRKELSCERRLHISFEVHRETIVNPLPGYD